MKLSTHEPLPIDMTHWLTLGQIWLTECSVVDSRIGQAMASNWIYIDIVGPIPQGYGCYRKLQFACNFFNKWGVWRASFHADCECVREVHFHCALVIFLGHTNLTLEKTRDEIKSYNMSNRDEWDVIVKCQNSESGWYIVWFSGAQEAVNDHKREGNYMWFSHSERFIGDMLWVINCEFCNYCTFCETVKIIYWDFFK